ncbi:hypothetical protein EIB75_10575 [Epilithonimonas vandammei]|uniref:Tail fiber protein n=1 Tax=Epilithonimonas vandammei TaxID=2487072 RepID=A0A3G8Z9T4_9FLAO|nr:hypothetical protein [Epilithonimonas vandammei]AZI53913.1 hypothetical protein EIB75_00965 [Epilithonimonas vandammei]AZI55667.1 hypothetical protein EIB75_10575 [Epilithonimonas vandammei]
MNNLSYNQTGGFPLSTNILDAAQTAYTIFNALGFLAGNYAIISGCEEIGNTVNNGVVFINGEVIEFRGGAKLDNVIILEDTETRSFENGQNKVVIHKRYACFGYSVENYAWGLFQRVFPTTLIKSFKDNFEARITALENKPSPIPIGTITRYDQPLVVLPPQGWVDYVAEPGRVWVQRDPNDDDFAFGQTGGAKKHQLTQPELPNVNLVFRTGKDRVGTGNQNSLAVFDNSDFTRNIPLGGQNVPHNNLQPYVAVRYIKYVG